MTYGGHPGQEPQYPQYPPAGYQPTQQYLAYQPPADQAWHPPVGYPTPPGFQPRTRAPKKRNTRWLLPTSVGVVALLVGVGIGAGAKGSGAKSAAASVVRTTATATMATTATATVQVTATPTDVVKTVQVTKRVVYTPPPLNSFSDGVQLIGTDIPAGTYKTTGQGDGSNAIGCYYAILNSSNTEDISNNTIVTGPTRVVLPAGKYFDTTGGCEWARVG
jgi:hypothetical protein